MWKFFGKTKEYQAYKTDEKGSSPFKSTPRKGKGDWEAVINLHTKKGIWVDTRQEAEEEWLKDQGKGYTQWQQQQYYEGSGEQKGKEGKEGKGYKGKEHKGKAKEKAKTPKERKESPGKQTGGGHNSHQDGRTDQAGSSRPGKQILGVANGLVGKNGEATKAKEEKKRQMRRER